MKGVNWSELDVCIDDYIGSAGFDLDELPNRVDPLTTSREELALARYKMWQPGQRLRIRFLDGEQALHWRVEEQASQWLKYANLEFEFGNFPDAEIRITFNGSGYRSLVGTDALKRPSPFPTMTLGGFTVNTNATELRRVVIHEFGHAIGCVHEQSSPSIDIPWDVEKVYAYYARYGWDKAKVDDNVLKRYKKHEVFHTEDHDEDSIMQYPVNKALTIGDFEIGWNTELSEKDKIFIAKMYPKEESLRW
ncbi:MAG: Tolloid-like protein 1 [Anaerolineaceae bacterium]|nr:Tolloid-like protein 1 [Anaerolineaceae bacterium]